MLPPSEGLRRVGTTRQQVERWINRKVLFEPTSGCWLWVGWWRDKGRMRDVCVPGEANPRARLTRLQVIEILEHLSRGTRQQDLARRYRVSTSAISNINTGKRWGHLKQERPPRALSTTAGDDAGAMGALVPTTEDTRRNA